MNTHNVTLEKAKKQSIWLSIQEITSTISKKKVGILDVMQEFLYTT